MVGLGAAGRKTASGRFVINCVNIEESPQFLAVFKKWRIGPELEGEIFRFVPPVSAKEIEVKKAPGSIQVK